MISIIIPVFNAAAKGLDECLQLVAGQTFADIQVIMVDDGSTDESAAICGMWAERDVRFHLYKQPHQGPAEARNMGLRQASGQEIAFVDSDDAPDVMMLQLLHEALEDQRADLAVADYAEGDSVQAIDADDSMTGRTLLKGILAYNTPMCKALYAKLYRREAIEGLWFDDLRTNEDIDFLSRVYLRVKSVAYVHRTLYRYRYHSDSIMHTQTAGDYMDILNCYESMLDRISQSVPELKGRALDALMRKVVSSRYRNRRFGDSALRQRADDIQSRHLTHYLRCDNGNAWVKVGIILSLLMPGLYASIMNYRER